MTPVEQLGRQLAAARRAGAPFATAWPTAISRVLARVQGIEREQWSVALHATREAWRTSWERKPAPPAQRARGGGGGVIESSSCRTTGADAPTPGF